MTIVSEFMGWLSWNDPPRRETGRNRSRRPTVPLMRESLPGQRGRPGPPGGVEPRSHLAAAPRPRQWLVAATRVTGAAVFDRDQLQIGELRDLSIDKKSGRIVYALAALGERPAAVERLHPLPWSLLKYDFDTEGYVFPLNAASIIAAPSVSRGELAQFGVADDDWPNRLAKHYDAYVMPSYI